MQHSTLAGVCVCVCADGAVDECSGRHFVCGVFVRLLLSDDVRRRSG